MNPAADLHDLAPLYAAGALDEAEQKLFESHLPDCPDCRRELFSLSEAAARLVLAMPLAQPPVALKQRLMERIRSEKKPASKVPRGVQEISAGIFIRKKDGGRFRPTPFPGVSFQLLHVDQATSMATSLLRMEPGAKYPQHRHSGLEQCLVVEGDIRMGETVLEAGDFEYGSPESFHDVIWTKDGCLLLIIASLHDEILG